MTAKYSIGNRIISVFLTIAILFTMVPLTALTAAAATVNGNRVADPSTMDSWKDYFPTTGEISTENAGGVWMDKSVLVNASEFGGLISQKDPNSFIVALSAMAANMSVTGMSNIPTDTILVLDVSGSMNDGDNDVAEALVNAANESIATLLNMNGYNRVGVVLYSGSSSSSTNYTTASVLLLPLGRYETGTDGKYLNYIKEIEGNGWNQTTTETISVDADVKYENTATAPTASSKEVVGATYIQRGVITAMNEFCAADNEINAAENRKPVIVLMSDGAPTLGSTNFTDPGYGQDSGYNLGNGRDATAALGFVSQLSAAYAKAKIEEKYGTDALFYTLGLGLSANDSVAISVMDPDNANASTAVEDFWDDESNWWGNRVKTGYLNIQVGEEVSLGNGRSVTKIETPLEQNYVDQYFEASGENLSEALTKAFQEIVGAIQLQSAYFPTLISGNEDLSGYISFVDKIGRYMEVTDVKGILIKNQLFSGADLAKNFVSGGGSLGTYTEPTALGVEMVAAVRTRLGLATDDEARTLIGLAYENGQLSYTDANHYSNYIGWYANAAGKFLGFYNEGTTVLPAATGNAETDPAFLVRSYGYLGAVDESYGVTESDMMYVTVQVREEIATSEQLVTFAVPAALIPVVTYNVTLDADGVLSDLTVSGADNPIRLVYEVALDRKINSFNAKQIVSEAYLADEHNVNSDGSINFYTNRWEHENKTGYGTLNTYSYFNPSRQNDKYYYLDDTLIYSDNNGTLYTGTAQPSAEGTFYRSYTVYKNNGSLRTETVYRPLSDEAKATARRNSAGTWYIPRGNVHVNMDGYTIHKSANKTGTLTEASIPFVDTHNHTVNDTGYQFYVGATLGNNGKYTVVPETGIKLTKTMADGVADPGEAFVFDIFNITDPYDGSIYPAWLVKADGTEVDTSVYFDDGNATVELNAGDVLYIGGMTAGETFRIVERESVAYVASATGLSQAGTVTVNQSQIVPVSFVNDERGTGNLTVAKEVEHDFGVDYQIPADKIFTIEVTLGGIGTANATFKAEHTNGTYTQITTDENGKFSVQLKHGEQFQIFGLPTGTTAKVVEKDPATGFAPGYWDNGVQGDGAVTVIRDSIVSVIVVNDYAAAEVYPVNITVTGNKQIAGRNWQQGDSFQFKLEKLLENGEWQQLGKTATSEYGKTAFDFNDAFKNERYTAPGIYHYRIVEIEPDTPLGGMSYDKTVHNFAVRVGDADMDGHLEITDVRSDRPDTTVVTESANGWNVDARFTNTYSATGSATVTIDVTKSITNNGGAEKTRAGYTFGLFDSATGAQVGNLLTTTERGFARFVLTYYADELGTFTYLLKEIAPASIPAGWSYSTDEIAVTVEVTDDGDGTISAVIYTGNEKPENAGNAIAASFTNTYDPKDALLEIDFVSKILSGRDMSAHEFVFEINERDSNSPATGYDGAGIPVAMIGTNVAADDGVPGRVVFPGKLQFSEVGTYTYDIKETSTDGNGIAVDKTVYRIVVTVTDDGGQLTASYVLVNAAGNSITFKNTYTVQPVDHTVDGTKTLRGRILINDEFTFVLTELTVDGAAIQNPRSWNTKNFSDGSFVFPAITYTKAGTYTYSVEEVAPEGGKAYGIVYDKTQYKVTVVVEDNGAGKLNVKAETVSLLNNTPASALHFVNEYKANPTSAQFQGDKTLTGKVNNALQGGEFEFVLYNADANWAQGTVCEKVENAEGGVITFTQIDLTTAEDRYFLVKEVNGGQTIDGVTYDDTVYRIWVEVTDDLKGQLHATVHIYDGEGIPQSAISFVNTYKVTGTDTVALSGIKTLETKTGIRELKENDFTFDLYKANDQFVTEGAAIQSKKNDKNGNFSFDDMEFSELGTYYFVIKENSQNPIGGVVYDNTQYYITVEVTDNGKGKLEAKVSMMKVKDGVSEKSETIAFVNEYNAAVANVTIGGNKILSGRDMVDGEFKFLMIAADETFTALEGAAPMAALNAGGKFSFDALSFAEVGTYYFIISEDTAVAAERISFDDAVYFVTIQVTDDENGKLTASDPVIVKKGSTDKVETVEFTNVFVPKPADITVDINIRKTVVNKGTDTIGPEDFEFLLKDLAGDADGITVKSDKDGKAKFTLTFTEDDIGKTYSYKLSEVNSGRAGVAYSTAEYAITVKITLDEETNTLIAELTKNEAATAELIAEFENIYDVDIPDNPKTADNSNLAMWMALLFVSGGAVITLCASGKAKRRQEEV